MKSKALKNAVALVAALTLTMGTLAGCGGEAASTPASASKEATSKASTSTETSKEASTEAPAEETNDTFIADRKVVIQAYVDDIGYALPEDTSTSPVFQEIKKRTGIDLEIRYTPSDSDSKTLAAQLAAGKIAQQTLLNYL